jgi:predicted RNA-binding Zn ribbon-like protein
MLSGDNLEQTDRPHPNGARLVGELRFDAGNLTLDLVATVGRRFGVPVERLSGPERLEAWVRGVGLCLMPGTPSLADLAHVRVFRERANEVVRAAITGLAPSKQALVALNSACAIPVALAPTAFGTDMVASSGGTVAETIVGLVARDTVLLLSGPGRRRIAECAARDCRMLYLHTPGGRRVWCSSAHCGNRNRVAANYARAKRSAKGNDKE